MEMINNKKFHKDYPIVIGLAGKAATGKTSVAEKIVPKAEVSPVSNHVKWDHLFFALPLYELASIRKNSLGFRQKDRQLFSIHEVVYDIFGSNALGTIPDYDMFSQLVKDIYNLPIEPEGYKPRSFLQKAGDLCRAYDEECFAKWGILKANKLFRSHMRTPEFEDQDMPMAIIISDVRFENEAKKILDQPNGLIICYEASDEVRSERMMRRDGHEMTSEQMNHRSEQEIDLIKEKASAIINTDNLNIAEQALATTNLVQTFTDVYA
jgi:dephospho-CoA kinase